MHGTYAANMAISSSDVILAVGARFDDRVTGKISEFAPHAKIIHIDIDPTSIQKNVRVDIPIVGDVKDVLQKMIKLVKGKKEATGVPGQDCRPGAGQIASWAKTTPLTYKPSKGKIKPQYVVEQIHKLTKGKAIVATEVGQNQMWAAQFYNYEQPRTFLSSGGLGRWGTGSRRRSARRWRCRGASSSTSRGTGSIQMNIQELATAVQYRIPVKVVILNNGTLGMVRPVAGALLRRELFPDVSPPDPRLREAGGGVRGEGVPRDEAGGGSRGAPQGVRRRRAGADRRDHGPRGDGLPDRSPPERG